MSNVTVSSVTIEMLVAVIGLLTLILGAGRFLYSMKSDIMAQISIISAQNAQFRLDSTKDLNATEKALNAALTENRTDITKLEGRVNAVESNINAYLS